MAINSSVTPQLITYMPQAGTTALPALVLQKTKHHILDTIAPMVSGSTIKPGHMALQYAEELGGKPEAQMVGSSVVTSAVSTALANGMLAHAEETDDSNGSAGIHPGCAVISAALAMTDRKTPAVMISSGRWPWATTQAHEQPKLWDGKPCEPGTTCPLALAAPWERRRPGLWPD